jgi:DNA-nicking Smr family endonuclease
MAARRLVPEERALWARVTATVRPLGQRKAVMLPQVPDVPAPVSAVRAVSPSISAPATRAPGDSLDGGWDRRLRRGLVGPDRTIDLHGHTLASAHDALDQGLDRAIADDVRLLLLITGRPPRGEGGANPRRGVIRAAIGDWLAASRHAGRIAAIRNAHPRHGGAGALYVILRRRR